jgi:tRNA(fMet)-specific endonuclease VapC
MNGEYLADTSVLVDLLRRGEVASIPKDAGVVICATVLGELYYGALVSARPQEQVARLEQFFSKYKTLQTSLEVIQSYAYIKCQLKRKGKMIPENDLWIAAFAKAHALPLLTSDLHFQSVEEMVDVVYVK